MSHFHKTIAKASNSQVTSSELLENKDAKWARLVKINYTDPLGQQRSWESAERITRPKNISVDGVGMIAVVERSPGSPEILLQKQFRPPVGKVCIEIPAGLIDANEDAETCAVRELKEETGFVGIVANSTDTNKDSQGIIFNDPGFTNTNLIVVHVDIDPKAEENQPENLKPELEDEEFIESFFVPLNALWTECRKLEAEGYAIDARVGTIAEGIELAKKWRLIS